jgi:uncharacterized SAM-binding protein YcdF (DUF218 family)
MAVPPSRALLISEVPFSGRARVRVSGGKLPLLPTLRALGVYQAHQDERDLFDDGSMYESNLIFYLSKLLPVFIYPVGLTISLFAAGGLSALRGCHRLAGMCFGAAVVIFWVCSTPVVATWVYSTLERQYPPMTMAETPDADVAIVLGGALEQPLPPRVEVDLSRASGRILHASRLYRFGKVKRILVAAGNIPWLPAVKPEADLIKDLLMEWGVPAEAIQLGRGSRNTYENALEIRAMLDVDHFLSALLVTSAAHMPRAMAVFRHAGIPVIASTTDIWITDDDTNDLTEWLPDADSLSMTTGAMKEWIGLLVYKMRGHL